MKSIVFSSFLVDILRFEAVLQFENFSLLIVIKECLRRVQED